MSIDELLLAISIRYGWKVACRNPVILEVGEYPLSYHSHLGNRPPFFSVPLLPYNEIKDDQYLLWSKIQLARANTHQSVLSIVDNSICIILPFTLAHVDQLEDWLSEYMNEVDFWSQQINPQSMVEHDLFSFHR